MRRDDDVLSRMAQGDESAAADCDRRYRRVLVGLARSLGLPRSEIDDAVQDALIKLWRNAATFNPDLSSEGTFVRAVAARALIDSRRRSDRQRVVQTGVSFPEPVDDSFGRHSELADEVARVCRAVRRMGRDAARLIALRFLDGLSYPAISRLLGSPVASVKTRARRTRSALRTTLG